MDKMFADYGNLISREDYAKGYALCAIQGESKKPDTFDIQMNNKGVSFF
jgi:hypothetical protein